VLFTRVLAAIVASAGLCGPAAATVIIPVTNLTFDACIAFEQGVEQPTKTGALASQSCGRAFHRCRVVCRAEVCGLEHVPPPQSR
jgi:hypothetical protein